jgi:hypothetical protein
MSITGLMRSGIQSKSKPNTVYSTKRHYCTCYKKHTAESAARTAMMSTENCDHMMTI